MTAKALRRAFAAFGLLACLIALAACPIAAWAQDDGSASRTCGYAYLEPIDVGDETYRLVLQETERSESASARYHPFGAIPADGRYDEDDEVGYPPWLDFNWLDGCENPRIAEVSITGMIRPRVTAYWFSGVECDRVDLSGIDFSEVVDMSGMFADSSITRVSFDGANLSNVVNADYLFSGCEGLGAVDLSQVNLPKASSARGMFSGSTSLVSARMPVFGSPGLEDASYLFSGCELLRSVDLGGLALSDAAERDGVEFAFEGCLALEEVRLPAAFSNEGFLAELFDGGKTWSPVPDGTVTCAGPVDVVDYLSGADGPVAFTANNGAASIVAIYDAAGKRLLVRTGEMEPGEELFGRAYPGGVSWSADARRLAIEHVRIENDVHPLSLAGWFAGFANLKDVEGLSNVDGSAVRSLSGMFVGCSSLSAIDLSAIEADSALDCSRLFEDCTSLTSVVAPRCAGSSVEDFSGMFAGCSMLGSVDLSGLDFSSATDLSEMFAGCSALEQLDGAREAFAESANVVDFEGMFQGCRSLTSSAMPGLQLFDMTSAENLSNMFYGCESLTTFSFRPRNARFIANASSMFYGCSSMTAFSFRDVDLSRALISGMLWACPKLETIEVGENVVLSQNANLAEGSWQSSRDGRLYSGALPTRAEATYTREEGGEVDPTSYVYGLMDSAGSFTVRDSAPSADGSAAFTVFPVNVALSFESAEDVPWHQCRDRITSVGIETIACDMSFWFCDCPKLASVDFSCQCQMDRLESTSMFARCPKLASVTFSEDSVKGARAEGMFADCTALEQVTFPKGSSLSSAPRMFSGCGFLRSVDMGEVSYLGDAVELFDGCTSLERAVLPERVYSASLAGMFRACSSLVELDVSGIDTSYPTSDFSQMFYGCSSLRSLDLSLFDTTHAASMKRMLHGCTALGSVTLGGNFTFRGAAWSRLAGSELPSGAWQKVDAEGNPVEGGKAYASDSLPNFTPATYRKVPEESLSSYTIESVRGDAEGSAGKYTIETELVPDGDGYIAELTLDLDNGSDDPDDAYASEELVIGEASKASSALPTVTAKTVTAQTLKDVKASSSKVHTVVVGPQVSSISAYAFKSCPGVSTVQVRSARLTTQKSVAKCLAQSGVRNVYLPTRYLAKSAKAKVKSAFVKWSKPKYKCKIY